MNMFKFPNNRMRPLEVAVNIAFAMDTLTDKNDTRTMPGMPERTNQAKTNSTSGNYKLGSVYTI